MKFNVVTHQDMEGNWVAQIRLGGVALYEGTGPVSERQAIDNATTGFAYSLRSLIAAQEEADLADA